MFKIEEESQLQWKDVEEWISDSPARLICYQSRFLWLASDPFFGFRENTQTPISLSKHNKLMKRNAFAAGIHDTAAEDQRKSKLCLDGAFPICTDLAKISLKLEQEEHHIWSLTDTELVMTSIEEYTKPLHSFVFLHQVYYNLSLNKSLVDKDVEILQKRRDVKRIHYRDVVNTSKTFTQDSNECIVLMSTKNYILDIDKHFSQVSATNNPIAMLALNNFRQWIFKTNFVTVTHIQLTHPDAFGESGSMEMVPAFGNDEIAFLLSAGYLRAGSDQSNAHTCTSYFFSHPKLGRVLNFMQWIEKSVVSKLSKLKFHEIRESKLILHLIQESSNFMNQKNAGKEANTKGSMLFSHELWRYHKLDLLGRKVLTSYLTADEKDGILRLG